MLLLVADTDGAVRAALPDGVEVVPGPGERIERTAHDAGEFARAATEATALGGGEVALVGGALVVRARKPTAGERALTDDMARRGRLATDLEADRALLAGTAPLTEEWRRGHLLRLTELALVAARTMARRGA